MIGVDLATPASYWKVGKINEGEPPFRSPDAEAGAAVPGGCRERSESACDDLRGGVHARRRRSSWTSISTSRSGSRDERGRDPIHLDSFEAAVRTIGRNMRADALVLVETTVPMGTCERSHCRSSRRSGYGAGSRAVSARERLRARHAGTGLPRLDPRVQAHLRRHRRGVRGAGPGVPVHVHRRRGAPTVAARRHGQQRARKAPRELVSVAEHRLHPRVDAAGRADRHQSVRSRRLDPRSQRHP